MIQSLKRLVRQMWVGARPAPTSEAIMMTPEDVATFSAQAKIRRENLKRAMETAFASAPPPVFVDEPVLLLDASVEVAEAAAEAARQEVEISNESRGLDELVATEHAVAAITPDVVEETSVVEALEIVNSPIEETQVVPAVEPEEAVVEIVQAAVAESAEPVVSVGAEPVLAECAALAVTESDVLSELMPAEETIVDVADMTVEPDDATVEASSAEDLPADDVLAVEPVSHDLADVALDAVSPASPGEVGEAAIAEVSPEVETAASVIEEPVVEIGQSSIEEAAEVPVAAPKAARAKKAAPKKKATDAPKKKASSKKSKTLDDDVWVSDAVAFSLNGAWPEAWVPPVDEAGAARLEEFRTKAAEGVLTIWGRAGGSDAWEPIKAAYWKSGTVEPMSFVEGREHVATEGKKSKGKAPAVYSALKVSRMQVEELWGSATAH